MASQKSKRKHFQGMSYRELQRANSNNRSKLKKEDINWLKKQGYKNVGWENLISLHHKMHEFLEKYQLEDLTLEDIFLEADRIGNKYLSNQEINDFNQRLAKEVSEIGEIIDQQFPDTEIEVIDFSAKKRSRSRKSNQKSYRTIKH